MPLFTSCFKPKPVEKLQVGVAWPGKRHQFDVTNKTTIGELKEMIHSKEPEMQLAHIHLSYRSKAMKRNKRNLGSYNVENDRTIVVKYTGPPLPPARPKTIPASVLDATAKKSSVISGAHNQTNLIDAKPNAASTTSAPPKPAAAATTTSSTTPAPAPPTTAKPTTTTTTTTTTTATAPTTTAPAPAATTATPAPAATTAAPSQPAATTAAPKSQEQQPKSHLAPPEAGAGTTSGSSGVDTDNEEPNKQQQQQQQQHHPATAGYLSHPPDYAQEENMVVAEKFVAKEEANQRISFQVLVGKQQVTLTLAANDDVWAIKLALEKLKHGKAGHMTILSEDGEEMDDEGTIDEFGIGPDSVLVLQLED